METQPVPAGPTEKELAQRAKQERHKQMMEESRLAKEEKLRIKSEKAAAVAAEIAARKEAKLAKKQENIEKMRKAQEEKKAKNLIKAEKAKEAKLLEEQRSKARCETTVVLTLDQQALLDQIKVVAESSAGAKVAKMNMISVGPSTQVRVTFEDSAQAKAFLGSKPEGSDLLMKLASARPLASPSQQCHFSLTKEDDTAAFADKESATTATEAALKAAGVRYSHLSIRGGWAVLEFATDAECSAAVTAINQPSFSIGDFKFPEGCKCTQGALPKRASARPAKKRKVTAMQD